MTRCRAWLVLVISALLALPTSSTSAATAAAPSVYPGPVPRAVCGPGSLPETGMQGRISPAEVKSGRAAKGYYCNTEQVGFHASRAGWKVARYGNCAYYNAEPGGLPLGLLVAVPGTHVMDVSNPAKPVQTDFLRTPAMQSPHESMSIDKKRGLLAAVFGNLLTAPGVLEIWDVKTDCRRPKLLSSLPVSLLGHEGNFSADGLTFYAGSLDAGTLTAVDVSDPKLPKFIAAVRVRSHGMSTNADGTRLYDTVRGGMVIWDTSEIQARKPGAEFKQISTVTWPGMSTPQFAFPVTIKGRPYVIETDEFGGPVIGAARIIDISDEKAPKVVSNVRLEAHMLENQEELADDAKPFLGGPYTGHYCSAPQPVEPGILVCSMLRSGVRVFDIRDPIRPKEIAYYSPPAAQDTLSEGGRNPGFHTGANVEFVPERGEMWLTDQETGFHVVRFTNGVWPFQDGPATGRDSGSRGSGAEGAPGGGGSAADGTSGGRSAGGTGTGSLPATGLPLGVPVALGAVLLAAAGVTARATRGRFR